MFTGLVEAVGTVAGLQAAPAGHVLSLETTLAADLAVGDSLAVNGVCLTVTSIAHGRITADIGPETARVTTLGSLAAGRRVNLERAMRLDARLGGHLVQGHVDATGTVRAIRGDGESHWVTVAYPEELAPLLIPKGAVTVDGVSLTVARLADDEFEVQIIPFTWEHTSLAQLVPGERVNLEGDMIGKYVVRALQLAGAAAARSGAR